MSDAVARRRIRELAASGLAAALAASVVLVAFDGGAHAFVALGGLLLAAGTFAWLIARPDRALSCAAERRSLPPRP